MLKIKNVLPIITMIYKFNTDNSLNNIKVAGGKLNEKTNIL